MKKLLLPLILMSGMVFGQVDSVKVDNKPFCKNKKEHIKKNKHQIRNIQKNKKHHNRHNRKHRAGRAIVRVIVIGGVGYYIGYTVGKNK